MIAYILNGHVIKKMYKSYFKSLHLAVSLFWLVSNSRNQFPSTNRVVVGT